jgi:hypothetical protein
MKLELVTSGHVLIKDYVPTTNKHLRRTWGIDSENFGKDIICPKDRLHKFIGTKHANTFLDKHKDKS